MKVVETGIEGLLILEPIVFGDQRGYFLESYNKKKFDTIAGVTNFVQDNESLSKAGVLRGLHFQVPPFEQAKLVRVIQGSVLDVAVDLRTGSPTYGKHLALTLSAENKRQFFVPRGFAHGFLVLEDDTIFSYKVDNDYAPEHENGILWSDPQLNIDWKLKEEPILSGKDKLQQAFKDFKSPF